MDFKPPSPYYNRLFGESIFIQYFIRGSTNFVSSKPKSWCDNEQNENKLEFLAHTYSDDIDSQTELVSFKDMCKEILGTIGVMQIQVLEIQNEEYTSILDRQ